MLRLVLWLPLACALAASAQDEHEDRLDRTARPLPQPADWAEPPGALPSVSTLMPAGFGPVTPTSRQPTGALSGRIVFMNAGHGWTWDPDYWRLQRGTQNEMNEDYGNLDQLNFFAAYCFNAGATVVSLRPLGQQTNEVVLDNDDPEVTFAGTWFDSTATYFFGSAGDVPYRFASLASNESATATYTPTIPVAGLYPVYTWVRTGSDRGDQLYRIRHTGGESQVRIPHHMVGNGWVYLGEYGFNAGSNPTQGSVVVSNLRGSAAGTSTFADAIRFGNGMGSVDRGSGVSGYPREEENCRYWIQASLGQGQSTALYDGAGADESDSWSAPPKMCAEMNREAEGSIHKRIHLSFHSNAGGGRGTTALLTTDPTPNQATLAQIAGNEVDEDLVALGSPPLEVAWNNRTTVTYAGGYSEIDGSLFNYEMDATILEVAFHDNASDALLLRDPKARAAVGRAALHAVVRYMAQFDGAPLAFLPEPPANVRATGAADGSITLQWDLTPTSGGSGTPTGYVIYRSTDGRGFGHPLTVSNVTRHRLTGLAGGIDHYFRVAAVNAGGESLPSETVGCRAPTGLPAPRVLVVNAFDRYDRTTNLRQNTARQAWAPPGPAGTLERVLPRRVNAFDYVVAHGQAIGAYGLPFDSCQNEAVANGQIPLGDYRIVVWACGQENTAGETFSAMEQSLVTAYRNAGGHLFVSGSDIGWDLDRASGPTASDRAFFNQQLKADFPSDANDNAGSYTVAPRAGSPLAGRGPGAFDDGSGGIYWVRTPDVLLPFGTGTGVTLHYGNGATAAVHYDGSAGGGRVVLFGFPFETLLDPALRRDYMAGVLAFLNADSATLVAAGSVWKYQDTGLDPGPAWPQPDYDDSTWTAGPAQLGFGDDDEATVVNTNRTRITTYFRRAFHVGATGELASVTLRLKRDDGAAVYLNGMEVYRTNLPDGPLSGTTPALTAVGGLDEYAWLPAAIPPSLLRTGTNMLAVEMHQNGTTSSDLSFDLELLATLRPASPIALVPANATWRYLDTGVNPGATWRLASFNDSAWRSGTGRFGFGGDGETTRLSRTNASGGTNLTFLFRHAFYLLNPAAVPSLTARLTRDDGLALYLNGWELLRDNLPDGPLGFGTLATAALGGADETNWLAFTVSGAALVPGWNLLGAEVHQAAASSSDLGFQLELRASVSLPPPPVLTIGDGMLSWPAETAFYRVECAFRLAPTAVWAPLTNAPSLIGNRWCLPVPPAAQGLHFFRLGTP